MVTVDGDGEWVVPVDGDCRWLEWVVGVGGDGG